MSKNAKDIVKELNGETTILTGMRLAGINNDVVEMIHAFWACMFPCQFGERVSEEEMDRKRERELSKGCQALKNVLLYTEKDDDRVELLAQKMMDSIPDIYRSLQLDILAGYEGDPAACVTEEVIQCYPAFKAISIYRMAHILYLEKVRIVPRIMSEYAHTITGIDIHPGAEIGKHFFIDHGTGVVIGETTVIGDNVKLYQHVTLGAKSFAVNADGSLVKGIKRHPNIGDNVVIYAGATILGGDTFIGDGCVIGGNVWLTHSVPAGSRIYFGAEGQIQEEH